MAKLNSNQSWSPVTRLLLQARWLAQPGFLHGFQWDSDGGCSSRVCRGYLHARLVLPAATPQSRHLPQAHVLVMSLTGNHFIWHQVTSDNLTLSDCTKSVLSYVYRKMSVLLVMKTLNVPVTMRKVMIPVREKRKKVSFTYHQMKFPTIGARSISWCIVRCGIAYILIQGTIELWSNLMDSHI